ncbi:MAG: hypothetical protein K2P07_13665 [Lachnospiraceae bacterium]|nr:hypothetical protein [Lachnospiraceae bacterium]
MISVICIWLYMLFTCYVVGFACVKMISGKTKWHVRGEIGYLYAGIGAVTVYAQAFSLFYKVGLWANVLLVLGCFVCLILFREEFAAQFHSFRLTVTLPGLLAVIALFLLFSYGTSRGIIHYDTGLYHAQSIRWIEEYGVVPGLGNLHSRLAYNSASFCLSALYSMAFLGGRSFHCCAGFLAFLLAVVCVKGFRKGMLAKPLLSDFVRIMGIYYLLNIFDEMISPASDYFMVLLAFYVLIKWLELLERKEQSYFPYALLCVMGVMIVSVKLSGALLLLLVLRPAWQMIREKRVGEILKFAGVGFLTAAPFLVRNVLLSGWLVYPFTAVDLFDFDFKIPKGMADYDAKEIQVWGRGFSDVTRYDEPAVKWLPEWAAGLDAVNKLFLALAISGVVVLALLAVYAFVRKKRDMADFLYIGFVVAVCFLFWLTSAPLIRYGCIFLWLCPVLTWGYLYLGISPHTDRFRVYAVLVLLLAAYKAGAFGSELSQQASPEYLLLQKDYENYETIPYELHGYTFYYPAHGDQTGYQDFPASPVKAEDIFRGETIEEGFHLR